MKTGAFTIEASAEYYCPIAKSRPSQIGPVCVNRGCVLFREMPMTCNSAWLEAVKSKAVEIGDKTAAKTEAARAVAADPEGHGLDRLFYCGLGGKPE
jgi:hypothetical protein